MMKKGEKIKKKEFILLNFVSETCFQVIQLVPKSARSKPLRNTEEQISVISTDILTNLC